MNDCGSLETLSLTVQLILIHIHLNRHIHSRIMKQRFTDSAVNICALLNKTISYQPITSPYTNVKENSGLAAHRH